MARKPRVKTSEEKSQDAYDEWIERIETFHKIAEGAYKAQNKLTREAIDAMADRIVAISFGVVRFHGHTHTVPSDVLRQNALYVATEICKDLAMLDIRVADYEFAPEICASCGKVLKKPKKKGKK